VSRPLTVALAGLILVSGALPVAFMVASGGLVGSVPAAVRGGFSSPAGHRLVRDVVIVAALFAVQQVTAPVVGATALALGRRVTGALRGRAMRAALAPVGVWHLEDPATLDDLSLVRGIGPGQLTPEGAVEGMAMIGLRYVKGAAAAGLLATFYWWLPLPLVLAALVSALWLMRLLGAVVDVIIGNTQPLRRSSYFRDLAITPGPAKETRVFGLERWLVGRFGEHWREAMTEVWKARRAGHAAVIGSIALFALPNLGAFAFIGWAGVRGHVTLRAFVIMAQAISGVGELCSLGQWDIQLSYGVAAVPAVLALEREAARQAPGGGQDAAGLPRHSIRFEGVTFRYPGGAADVCRGLDLTVPAGRSLAIVGANGAGKTTLVKLLCRLYDPSAGRITVDGTDLAQLDVRSWRARVGAIFQDFVHYELSAADNVGFGALDQVGDHGAIEEAARRAGIGEVLAGLPNQLHTPLSRRFTGGVDLSGGEWQRVALARALFAVQAGGAGVLVLDEPTANLDVRAEAELYDRFLELTRGLTSIVISHRFSTVRRADRIVVLDRGRVVEDGTHDQLVAAGGLYAEMFRLQATRFAETEAAGALDA